VNRPALLVAALLVGAAPLAAQSAATTRVAAPSTRATATVSLEAPRVQGQARPAALTVTIDYGQPHARGRDVPTELAKDGTVWRTGANAATTLTTQADLTIGGVAVPAGAYSLYSIREGGKYFLIINRNTGQWGTEYDASKDHARVPLTARTTAEVTESMSIALVPAEGPPARGQLTIAWGKLHLSTEWSIR
jgi:hypothetical protein